MFKFRSSSPTPPKYSLDIPGKNQLLDPLGFKLEGWAQEYADKRISRVEFWVEDQLAGSTSLMFERPDVALALKTNGTYRGFAMFGLAPWMLGKSKSLCKLITFFETESEVLATFEMTWATQDYRKMDYGSLLEPTNEFLHHRSNIYSSGPSVTAPSPEGLQLVQRYLGAPPLKVLDVGCGVGAYGEPLIAQGYDWMGVEVKESDCLELKRKGMPHQHTAGGPLPFSDESFEASICIEVLEHIQSPETFLREIRRVTQMRAIFSVPNIEILPYMRPLLAAPWHILEADHKNFFTRNSLRRLLLSASFSRVEIIPYGVPPLRSIEGFPLYYHLLAICDC